MLVLPPRSPAPWTSCHDCGAAVMPTLSRHRVADDRGLQALDRMRAAFPPGSSGRGRCERLYLVSGMGIVRIECKRTAVVLEWHGIPFDGGDATIWGRGPHTHAAPIDHVWQGRAHEGRRAKAGLAS